MSAASSAPVSTNATKPLSFMKKLNALVSVYQPPNASITIEDRQPRLIIISSWTDARDAHIAKYMAKYQDLYPAAQILLLRSTMGCIFRPSQIDPAMKVAASLVRATFQDAALSTSPPLLIHIFSNGGSSSITSLYKQFTATAGPNDDKRLPPHVTIFDSCPGLFHIPYAVAFVSVGLPFFQKVIATPFLYAFGAFWTLCMSLGIFPRSLDEWYRSHNHDAANAEELRRVYIYTPADTLTDYKDVEAHAAEAKQKGFSVALEKYERSAHVAHLRKDEKRYWDIVRRLMDA